MCLFSFCCGYVGDDTRCGDGCDFALFDGDAIGRRLTDVGKGEGDHGF